MKSTAHGAKVKRDIGRGVSERPWFLKLCTLHGLQEPCVEWKFALPERRFAFDYAWPESRVALEVQGGIFVHGGHNRGPQYAIDATKFNMACERGWLVLQCVPGEKDRVGYRENKDGSRTETFNLPGLLNLSTVKMLKRVIDARFNHPPIIGAQQRELLT